MLFLKKEKLSRFRSMASLHLALPKCKRCNQKKTIQRLDYRFDVSAYLKKEKLSRFRSMASLPLALPKCKRCNQKKTIQGLTTPLKSDFLRAISPKQASSAGEGYLGLFVRPSFTQTLVKFFQKAARSRTNLVLGAHRLHSENSKERNNDTKVIRRNLCGALAEIYRTMYSEREKGVRI